MDGEGKINEFEEICGRRNLLKINLKLHWLQGQP